MTQKDFNVEKNKKAKVIDLKQKHKSSYNNSNSNADIIDAAIADTVVTLFALIQEKIRTL